MIPSSWKNANTVTIFKKKDDRADCGNYRRISFLDVTGKTFICILLTRLIDHITECILPESQCGFRANRSTLDRIFVSQLLVEKCTQQHCDFTFTFIDLTNAFDSINRQLLWQILERFGCPPRFVNILQLFHDGMVARAVAGGDMGRSGYQRYKGKA